MKGKVREIKSKTGIELSYHQINDRVFAQAMEKLDNFTGFSTKELFHFNKLKDRVDRESSKAKKIYSTLVKKYAIKDADGKVDLSKGMPELEDEDAFKKEFDEFLEHKFSLNCAKFATDNLVKAGLTPKEIRKCARIISDVDPDLLVEDKEEDGSDQLG